MPEKESNGLFLANTMADARYIYNIHYMARDNPIYVQANATSRRAVSIHQST